MALELAAAPIASGPNYSIVNIVADAATPQAAATFTLNQATYAAAYLAAGVWTGNFQWNAGEVAMLVPMGHIDWITDANEDFIFENVAGGIISRCAANAVTPRVAGQVMASIGIYRHSIIA